MRSRPSEVVDLIGRIAAAKDKETALGTTSAIDLFRQNELHLLLSFADDYRINPYHLSVIAAGLMGLNSTDRYKLEEQLLKHEKSVADKDVIATPHHILVLEPSAEQMLLKTKVLQYLGLDSDIPEENITFTKISSPNMNHETFKSLFDGKTGAIVSDLNADQLVALREVLNARPELISRVIVATDSDASEAEISHLKELADRGVHIIQKPYSAVSELHRVLGLF